MYRGLWHSALGQRAAYGICIVVQSGAILSSIYVVIVPT
jgi:hypothetical protein